ncbi:MAG: RidA family protein [Acidimicrobiia bacterium]|nr:MAG: RidA family protein [Acidimicrobiia bacterium]
MTREGIVTPAAPTPAGPYSHVAFSGPILAVAGQAGIDPVTGDLVGPDIGSQTHQTFANIRAALEAAGSSFADVIQVRVFLADLGEFEGMNEVYGQQFAEPYPARTTVGTALAEGLRVEIDVLAVRN